MNFSYILNSAVPQKNKLICFGFEECGEKLILKKQISSGEFYVLLQITEKTVTAEVFETETREKYVLFDVPSAQGAFVGALRNEVKALIDEVRRKCFDASDINQKYLEFLESEFCTCGDTPWADEGDTTSTVYRLPNRKWFALVMKIKFKNLGFESDEPVWVVNLKAENIDSIVDRKSVFPAYHMNKKYWITVLLTSVTDFDQLCALTRRSYELVRTK